MKYASARVSVYFFHCMSYTYVTIVLAYHTVVSAVRESNSNVIENEVMSSHNHNDGRVLVYSTSEKTHGETSLIIKL